MRSLFTLSLLFAATVAHAQFDAIRTLTPEQAQEVRSPIEAKIFHMTAAERPTYEAALLEIFKAPATTVEGKQYACRMLCLCASETSVPVLAPELTNPELSSFVRLVLQGLESDAADKALIAALPTAENALKPGIIGTLGQRGSSGSVAAIAPYLTDANVEIQFAAITALGNIDGKSAAKALAKAKVLPAHADELKQARIKNAASLKPRAAAKTYGKLLNDSDENISIAALVGLANAAPSKAAPSILTALNSESLRMRNAATGLLIEMPTTELIAIVSSLSADNQILVLNELSARQATAAETAVLALTASGNKAVVTAAFEALGQLGGTEAIPILLNNALQTPAAFDALCALNAKGTDAAILEQLKTDTIDKSKVKWMECLTARKAKAALPEFIALANGNWSRTCAAAISGMANLVSEADFKTYAQMLLVCDSSKKLGALEESIATAALRQPDTEACALPLVAAFASAEGDTKYAIIRTLGSIGGTAAQQMLSESMASTVPEIQDAAVRGICNWPNADVADQLLELAQTTDNEKYKVLALRAYLRMANMYPEAGQALPMCNDVIAVTQRADLLKSTIACIQRFRDVKSFPPLVTMLDNPAVSAEASRAILNVSYGWKTAEASVEPLEKALGTATNPNLIADLTARLQEVKGN